MADLADETTEDGECCAVYGIKDVFEGIPLPNFKDFRQAHRQWVIDTFEANLPRELRYRGYVPTGRYRFAFEEIELSITVDLNSNAHPVASYVENNELSRKVVDAIRAGLRELTTREIAAGDEHLDIRNLGLIALRLLEETTACLQEYRRMYFASDEPSLGLCNIDNTHGTRSNPPGTLSSIYGTLSSKLAEYGVKWTSTQSIATQILGKTPAQLHDGFCGGWRILHMENVLRGDLQSRFFSYQSALYHGLMRMDAWDLCKFVPHEYRHRGHGVAAKEQMVEYLVKPRISFHGTHRDIIPSIVQFGLLKPGDRHPLTKEAIPVENGRTYGQGIYTSPEAWYSLVYSNRGEVNKPSELPGIKIVICATIMGRAAAIYDRSNWGVTRPTWGADSHMSGDELEWICFDSAQVLPCYVLHLDWAGKNQEEIAKDVAQLASQGRRKNKKLDGEVLLPGDKQRLKEEKLAKAKKFFAYGFGPVSGRNIVIEDIADIEDDEEDYGDYQMNRIIEGDPPAHQWQEGDAKLDQYRHVRRA